LSTRATGGQYLFARSAAVGYAPLLAAIRALPIVARHGGRRVRRVLQRIVGAVGNAVGDVADLVADRDHRRDEAIELADRFAFGRLDHQRAGHRKAHRRRVEAVVHQPLGDVVDGDVGLVLQRPQIEDAFVRDEAAEAGVEHGIVTGETPRDVVGCEDRRFSRRGEAAAAHHRDVHPRDRQDRCAAERCGADRTDLALRVAIRRVPMPWQERREVRAHADRPHAGTATAVRDAKGLVQVEMRDVGAEFTRCGQPDERVQVRAVDVHLPAVRMHDLADALDAGLEHAVRRRVRRHDRREPLRVLRSLGFEVGEIDVAVVVAGDDDNLHADHLRRRGIGAVRRRRDQADVAVRFVAARVISLDREQPRVFALRAGVGLQRHRRITGDRAEHPLEIRAQLAVAFDLVRRRERMQLAELGPRHRHHLARRVQLHRARAERNHRAVERDVAIGETPQVAQHLGLAAVAMERRMRQEFRAARERRRQRVGRRRIEIGHGERRFTTPENPPDRLDVFSRRRLVERDAERARIDDAEIGTVAFAARDDVGGGSAGRDGQRVEEFARGHGETEPHQTCAQDRGEPMHAPRDRAQAVGPVIDGVHAAITASSTCAVQMFDVAFSRRMCCSRVCSARRYARPPSASTVTPTSRPASSA
jgi:hypothetical protein